MGIVLTIIQIIATVVQFLPSLLSAVQAIVDFIKHLHQSGNTALAATFLSRLRDAVTAARHGNPQPLQQLAADVQQHCANGACTTKG